MKLENAVLAFTVTGALAGAVLISVANWGQKYDAKLMQKAIQKADVSKDHVLQSRELSSMLKQMGYSPNIPNNYAVFVGGDTHVRGSQIILGRSDLEKYIAK